jgi:hypothetical protein
MERSGKRKLALFLLIFLPGSLCLAYTFLPGPPPGGDFETPESGNVYLAGSRVGFAASVYDYDICQTDCYWWYVADLLAYNTPQWQATLGSFPLGNQGGMVTWQAPDFEYYPITIEIYVEDLPWYADDTVTTPSETVDIGTLVPYVDYVSFDNYDIHNPNEHFIYPIYDPVWTWDGDNEPVSYTKNTYERVVGEFGHLDVVAETEYVNVAPDDTGYDYWEAEAIQIAAGGYGTYGKSGHASIGRLPDTINIETRLLNWSYLVPDGSWTWILMQDSPTGPHTLYTVFGPPKCERYEDYTKSNLAEAVGKAIGGTDEPNIASKANDAVDPNIYGECMCASGFQANFDAAMGRHPPSGPWGMCCCRAEGLNCVLEILGIGPYTHVWVNERAEPGNSEQIPASCATCGTVYRGYWAGPVESGFWNNWEGAIRSRGAGTRCYSPVSLSDGFDEGTYAEYQAKLSSDYGFYWVKYPGKVWTDRCPHNLPPPSP